MAVDEVGRAFLVDAVRPLHPEEQTVAEMLQGWRNQQLSRNLQFETIDARIKQVQRFIEYCDCPCRGVFRRRGGCHGVTLLGANHGIRLGVTIIRQILWHSSMRWPSRSCVAAPAKRATAFVEEALEIAQFGFQFTDVEMRAVRRLCVTGGEIGSHPVTLLDEHRQELRRVAGII